MLSLFQHIELKKEHSKYETAGKNLKQNTVSLFLSNGLPIFFFLEKTSIYQKL